MNEGKSIRFVMLVSPIEERRQNAMKVKELMPDLEIVYADKNECDLFTKHLEVLKTDKNQYAGVLMMEDDIILSRRFYELFNEAISAHSDDVIQFFERALRKTPLPRGYAPGSQFYSCVCYYMPAAFTEVFCSERWIRKFKEWYPSLGEPWNYPIDTYIQYVMRNNNMIYWREFPWIVQHGLMRSNFKGRSLKRQSKFFIDDLETNNGDQEN